MLLQLFTSYTHDVLLRRITQRNDTPITAPRFTVRIHELFLFSRETAKPYSPFIPIDPTQLNRHVLLYKCIPGLTVHREICTLICIVGVLSSCGKFVLMVFGGQLGVLILGILIPLWVADLMFKIPQFFPQPLNGEYTDV